GLQRFHAGENLADGSLEMGNLFLVSDNHYFYTGNSYFQKDEASFCRCTVRRKNMSEIAIAVNHLNKIYRLYDKPVDRLKESLGLSRKKKYKEHYALRDVSFTVEKGETVGIIGTNGSGKSTILKIITGVLNPTGG